MTPSEMVTEIGSISGGGGSADKVLLQTIELDEDVALVQFDVSNYVDDYNAFLFEIDLSTGASEWLYRVFNGTKNGYYSRTGTSFQAPGALFPFCEILGKGTDGKVYSGASVSIAWNNQFSTLQTIGFTTYKPDEHPFLAGGKVTMYGLEASLC